MGRIGERDTCIHGHPWTAANIYLYPDGRRGCRLCSNEADVRWRKAHPEKAREVGAAWRKRNPEKVKAFANARDMYQKRYGISKLVVNQMLLEQNYKCGICDRRIPPFHLDHNHQTRKVRGLLCQPCNHALGFMQDSIEILRSAIWYLLKYKD